MFTFFFIIVCISACRHKSSTHYVVLDGQQSICYRLANMAGYYILQTEICGHSIFINYAKKCTFSDYMLVAGR